MPDAEQRTPFQPEPRDFAGHRMPPTVPFGTRLEPTGPDDSVRPLLAALANPAAREAFARVVLVDHGILDRDPSGSAYHVVAGAGVGS